MDEETTTTEAPDLEAQIDAAIAAGDWNLSGRLKNQRLDAQRKAAAPAPLTRPAGTVLEQTEDEVRASIMEQIDAAQAAGDWTRSFALKSELQSRRKAGA